MIKAIFTLFRGRAHEAAEDFTDRNALAILRQQIRDCVATVASARKAVAVAIAQNDQEVAQHKQVLARIADLETRTIAAMEQGRTELAREAAESIALLEGEKTASEEAQAHFVVEIARMKTVLRKAETRLLELQRGQRIAAATDKAQRLRVVEADIGTSSLREAEETLSRLRMRQQQIDSTADAMAELERTDNPATLTEKLAEAGCGAPLRSSADDVLARLAERTRKSA